MSDREQDAYRVPDWLSGVGDDLFADTEPDTPLTTEAIPDNEPMPDWLTSLVGRTEGFEPPTTIVQPPITAVRTSVGAEESLPDWLREEQVVEAPGIVGELPLWLQPTVDRQAMEFGFDMPASDVPPAADELAIPTELASDLPGNGPIVSVGHNDSTQITLDEDTLPETMRAEGGQEESDVPDWLRELQQMSSAGLPIETPGTAHDSEVGLTPQETPEAELPVWLQQAQETTSMGDVEIVDDIFEAELSDGFKIAEESRGPKPGVAFERLPDAPAVPGAGDGAPIASAHPESLTSSAEPGSEETAMGQTEPDAEQVEAALEREARAAVEPLEPSVEESAELRLARREVEAGNWPEALTLYAGMVCSSQYLDDVIGDLEARVRSFPHDFEAYQLLGDAYANKGMLPSALKAYRAALEKLHS